MPYDELGNYIPESLALDEMRYELAKKNQIPEGYEYAKRGRMPLRSDGSDVPMLAEEVARTLVPIRPPEPKQPASSATNFAQAVADKLGISAIPQALMAMGTGFPAEVAKGMGFSDASKAMQYEPTSRAAKDILAGVEEVPRAVTGSHMGFGPLPETWVSGIGHISPSDVQVLGARGINTTRELRAVPEDFRAAQAGLKRQNIYGEPTYGVRAQGVAEGIGDILARREAAGKPAVPGMPDIFPETRMYAVRNTGEGQLLTPTDRPGVNTRDVTNYGQIARVNEAALGFNPQTFREQPIEQFNRYMDEFINPEGVPDPIRRGWSKYFQERVQSLFPEATDKNDATQAWSQLVSPTEQVRLKNQFLEEFVALPENKELARASGRDLPSVDEYKARVEAAEKWLKGPFNKGYVQKFLGTKDDPVLQQTEKGLSPVSADMLLQEVADLSSNRIRALEQHREQAGFNPKGEYLAKVNDATLDLVALKARERELSTRQNEIARQFAETNPGEDPATLSPEFAALSNQVTAKVNEIEKLERRLDNLKAAQAYETLSDYAILPHTAGEVKQDMTFVESQLFPGLAKTPDEAKVIELSRVGTQGSGIESAAKQYVQDIITGKIPINQISNTSFEKHIGKQAGVRVQAEQTAKLAQKKKIDDLNNYAKEQVSSQPEYLRFGNANVVEFNKFTPLKDIRTGLSFETEMLDHCLGSGGSGAGRKHFITGEDRSHTPIIDPITGEVPKGSSGNDRGYVDHVRSGKTEIASVRDVNTGYPAVTIEFNKSGKGQYNLGYVSGYKNRVPETQYRNATRDYLNSRADEIAGIGSNLERYGIYDQNTFDNAKLSRISDLPIDQISREQLAELPRFLTQDDIKKALNGEVVDIPPLPARPSREMLPAVTNDAVNIQVREYRSWLNDRYPDIRERLSQINEDISDINNGRVGAGQYGLTEEQFPNFANELSNYSDQLRAQYENPNVTPANPLVDLYGREVANISRDLPPAILDETINHLRGITNVTRFRDDPTRFIQMTRERSRFLDAGDPDSPLDIGEQRAVSSALGALANQLERGVPEAPVQVRNDNGINRLIREEQHNIDRAWEDVLPTLYDYEGMTPAQIREQAATLRRDPSAVLREYDEQFLMHPGFIEGLARQIEEQANQQEQLLREMGGGDLNQALDDSLQAIRGMHGEQTFNRTIEIANSISNDIDLTADPERYISELRQTSDIYTGEVHSALVNLADDLEAAHLGNWEAEPAAPELLPHEHPLQPFAPRGEDPTLYRNYYTAEASGSTQAFDQIMQAERMTPGAIYAAIERTDGRAMYDQAVMDFYGVDSPAGVSQINHALRRYIEGRGEEQPQLPAPARGRDADHLPDVPDIPMGENFLSDAIDTMLDDDHIDGIMEMYRGVAEDIDTLSDRGSQRDILRRVRQYADQMEDMGDQEFANAIHEVADRMRAAIIQASVRPEGHKRGGYIQKMKDGGQPEPMSEFDKALSQPGLKHKFTQQDLLNNYGDSVVESFDRSKARKRIEPVALKYATQSDNYDDGAGMMSRSSVPLGKAPPAQPPSSRSMEDMTRQHMPLLEQEQVMRRGAPVYKKGGRVHMNEGGMPLPEDIQRAVNEGRITQNQADYLHNARLNPVPEHWGDHMSYQDRYNESLEPRPKYVPPTEEEVRVKKFLDKQDPMQQPNVDMNREQLKKHAEQTQNPATFRSNQSRTGGGGGIPSGGPSADMKQIMNPRNIVYKKGGAVDKKPVYFAENPDAMRYEILRNK